MIPRHAVSFLRECDWGGIAFEHTVVALGLLGIQASNWIEARTDKERAMQVAASIKADLRDSLDIEQKAIGAIDAGLRSFEAARARSR
jgi:hypothetical protein